MLVALWLIYLVLVFDNICIDAMSGPQPFVFTSEKLVALIDGLGFH